ncbi:type I methionyl aminopeptidase [Candidatus Falkowbacteria bacterium]|nr:type I methionyl aminopeptidase [Candidatus Falkowbacteria bacterium]
MSLLKSADEIKILKQGGKILAGIIKKIAKAAKPGITTRELDELAERLILENGGAPSFKGYGEKNNPYPAALCTSVNEQIVHGVPGDYILKSGDIVGLDIGMRHPNANGLYTDMAVTVGVGKINEKAKKLIKVTRKALDVWLKNIKSGEDIIQISAKVQAYVEKEGFSVIRELVGHGVGHAVHEQPAIPNYFSPAFSFKLKEGMVLALEPMVSAGDFHILVQNDNWSVITRDHSLCAHFEHTVLVTENGCEVLTK